MNTVYPNKKRRHFISGPLAPGSVITPALLFMAIEIGDGFWGFVPGYNVLLGHNLDSVVIGNTDRNRSTEIQKVASGFLLIY